MVYKTLVRPALSNGAGTSVKTIGQEARLEVNEMRMLRLMCGVTRRDKIRNEHITGTTFVIFLDACTILVDNKSGASVQENYSKTTEVVRQCDENERGAHSEKNARCGHTREKKKRAAEPKVEKFV